MGRFVASLLTTVDGFDGNDHFEPTSEEHQVFNDLLARTNGIVFDRENQELLVPYWDEVDVSDPASPEAERQFAELFRTRRRWIVADSLSQPDALATLIEGDPIAELRALKTGTADDLMVAAGPELCSTLLDHGLIDELELLMLPIVVGSGPRSVGELARKQPLALIEARELPSGAVVLHYRVHA